MKRIPLFKNRREVFYLVHNEPTNKNENGFYIVKPKDNSYVSIWAVVWSVPIKLISTSDGYAKSEVDSIISKIENYQVNNDEIIDSIKNDISNLETTKANKKDLDNLSLGLNPQGRVDKYSELSAVSNPKDGYSYIVGDRLDSNGNEYIYRYSTEEKKWKNTYLISYIKDVASIKDVGFINYDVKYNKVVPAGKGLRYVLEQIPEKDRLGVKYISWFDNSINQTQSYRYTKSLRTENEVWLDPTNWISELFFPATFKTLIYTNEEKCKFYYNKDQTLIGGTLIEESINNGFEYDINNPPIDEYTAVFTELIKCESIYIYFNKLDIPVSVFCYDDNYEYLEKAYNLTHSGSILELPTDTMYVSFVLFNKNQSLDYLDYSDFKIYKSELKRFKKDKLEEITITEDVPIPLFEFGNFYVSQGDTQIKDNEKSSIRTASFFEVPIGILKVDFNFNKYKAKCYVYECDNKYGINSEVVRINNIPDSGGIDENGHLKISKKFIKIKVLGHNTDISDELLDVLNKEFKIALIKQQNEKVNNTFYVRKTFEEKDINTLHRYDADGKLKPSQGYTSLVEFKVEPNKYSHISVQYYKAYEAANVVFFDENHSFISSVINKVTSSSFENGLIYDVEIPKNTHNIAVIYASDKNAEENDYVCFRRYVDLVPNYIFLDKPKEDNPNSENNNKETLFDGIILDKNTPLYYGEIVPTGSITQEGKPDGTLYDFPETPFTCRTDKIPVRGADVLFIKELYRYRPYFFSKDGEFIDRASFISDFIQVPKGAYYVAFQINKIYTKDQESSTGLEDLIQTDRNYLVTVYNFKDNDFYDKNRSLFPKIEPWTIGETTMSHSDFSVSAEQKEKDFIKVLDDYEWNYKKVSIGKDQSGQYDMFGYEILPKGGVYKETIAFTAHIHGDERRNPMGLMTTFYEMSQPNIDNEYLKYIRDNFRWVGVWIANPWGYDKNSRLQSRGVNINRNADYRWEENKTNEASTKGESVNSEAETKNILKFFSSYKGELDFYLDWHDFSGKNYPYAPATNTEDNNLSSIHQVRAWLEKINDVPKSQMIPYANPDASGGIFARYMHEVFCVRGFTSEYASSYWQPRGYTRQMEFAKAAEMNNAWICHWLNYKKTYGNQPYLTKPHIACFKSEELGIKEWTDDKREQEYSKLNLSKKVLKVINFKDVVAYEDNNTKENKVLIVTGTTQDDNTSSLLAFRCIQEIRESNIQKKFNYIRLLDNTTSFYTLPFDEKEKLSDEELLLLRDYINELKPSYVVIIISDEEIAQPRPSYVSNSSGEFTSWTKENSITRTNEEKSDIELVIGDTPYLIANTTNQEYKKEVRYSFAVAKWVEMIVNDIACKFKK